MEKDYRKKRVSMIKLSTFILIFHSFVISAIAQQIADNASLDQSKKQLIVPMKNIEAVYYDNVSKLPKIEHSDSYYAQVTDQIIFKELSKSFKSVEILTDSIDVNKIYSLLSYDKDSGKVIRKDNFSKVLQEIATKYKADFIVLPEFCKLTYKTIHQKNWREAKGGSSYERPVNVVASSEFSMAFYQKDGVFNREAKGVAQSKKPLFYSYAKKGKYEKDVVDNSRKKYAPPLLKALSKSIGDAFNNL